MGDKGRQRHAFGEKVILVLVSPLIFAALLIFVLVAPFVWIHRFLFRVLVELLWGRQGTRILLVYSDSPHWKEYIERHWLPRLGDHAVVLNSSRKSTWRDEAPFALRVFKHWAPQQDYNPMAVLFPALRPARTVGFYYAFRDSRHGKDQPLRDAESTLFDFVDSLERSA